MFTIDTDKLPTRDGVIVRATLRQIPTLVAKGLDFDGNSMSGRALLSGLSPCFGHEAKRASYFAHYCDAGTLSGADLAAFNTDATVIAYVVRSYDTPIAWRTTSGRWHIVTTFFSMTTRRHQGALWMVGESHDAVTTHLGRGKGWQVDCNTCAHADVTGSTFTTRAAADDAAYRHRRNG